MFERYTEPARRTIFFARFEAAKTGSPYIETEHLLLGVLRQDHALVLRLLGSEEAVESLRAKISSPEVVTRKVITSVDLPLSHQSKRVLAYGAEESQRLAHRHIGTEHLLLGLMREKDSRAAQALLQAGLDLSQVREYAAQESIAGAARPDAEKRAALHYLVDELPPNLLEVAAQALRAVQVQAVIGSAREQAPPAAESSPASVNFARYSERARRSIFWARYEASQFGSHSIETEHLLLGILREHQKDPLFPSGIPTLEEIRREVEQRKPPSGETVPTSVDLPLSEECQRALAFAADEATRLKHDTIENRHLLLGLLREENGLAAKVLRAREITIEEVRNNLLGGEPA
jgi:ATP-dependent Clp protease ATP-binding subunit ClpA